jgi:hypothetical protein
MSKCHHPWRASAERACQHLPDGSQGEGQERQHAADQEGECQPSHPSTGAIARVPVKLHPLPSSRPLIQKAPDPALPFLEH